MATKETTELAARLQKATPDQLGNFAGMLLKRAEYINKAMDGLTKARTSHDDMMDKLEKLKDHLDDLKDGAEKAEKAGTLSKVVPNAVTGALDSYAGVLTAAKGIAEAHDLIGGSLEEYADEANTQADAGLAAAEQHPTLQSGAVKMVRTMERQMATMTKNFERSIKKMQQQQEELIGGFTGGFTKAFESAAKPVAQVPMRTAITVEKSADGTGGGTLVKMTGGNGTSQVQTTVPPLLGDGVTPNPEFAKLAEANGDACQKALKDIRPQSGNPFQGIEELVQGARR